MLTKQEINKDYNEIVKLAEEALVQKSYAESLGYIETAANIAYNFNIIYADAILEQLLSEISVDLLKDKAINEPINKRVVFYDVFGMVNRGLTQQYLRALMDLDCEFLYILENKHKGVESILNEFKDYKKAQVVIIDETLSVLDKIYTVFDVVNEYRPQKALLHLHPASVVAVTVWNAFTNVDRYQVNLTDHAFWLGVNCIDYCLEFRDYGCTVSTEKRGIDHKKVLMQPYYPILDCDKFSGLPAFHQDKVIVFTGGTYYKMYGDNNAFFKLLNDLVMSNENLVIIIAGDGDELPLKDFIINNKLDSQIYLIGKRADINHIFEKSDIYLSTYPITGGLMAQFAALNSKPILSYSTSDIPCNDVDSLLTFRQDVNKQKITKDNLKDFFAYAKKLTDDKEYRLNEGRSLTNRVIDPQSFAGLLHKNLFNATQTRFDKIKIDYDRFADLYIEVANKFVFNYHKLILKRFKLRAVFLYPNIAFSKWTLKMLCRTVLTKAGLKN